MTMKEYKKFAFNISLLLKIQSPQIEFVQNLMTETMLAMYDMKKEILYIKKSNLHYDLCFAIVHELRHIWQLNKDRKYYYGNYKEVIYCKDTEEYNNQIAEIDANAFASIIMQDTFEIMPLFNGLSKETTSLIKIREVAIIENYIY